MVELTDLNGVAEGRAENLTEAGYESVEDLVDADAETVAESVNYLPEDTALELIVQAGNIVAEEESDGVVEDEPESASKDESSITEEVEEAVEEVEKESEKVGPEKALDQLPDDDELEEEVDELEEELEEESEPEPDTIDFAITFDEGLEYDTFFDAVMEQRSSMLRTNRSGVEAFDHALEQMRDGGINSPVELSLEKQQLNDLHNCVRQKKISYKGDNLIDHMDALQQAMNQIDDVREEYLF